MNGCEEQSALRASLFKKILIIVKSFGTQCIGDLQFSGSVTFFTPPPRTLIFGRFFGEIDWGATTFTFGHANFGGNLEKCICNLGFGRLDPIVENTVFLDFRRSIVKNQVFSRKFKFTIFFIGIRWVFLIYFAPRHLSRPTPNLFSYFIYRWMHPK